MRERTSFLAKAGYSAEHIKRLKSASRSVSAVIQIMLLSVHALGYGSFLINGPTVAQDAFKTLIG